MNGDDKLLGELHAMMINAQEQRSEMFRLLREVRESGCVVGRQHDRELRVLENNVRQIERCVNRAITVAAAIGVGIVGIDRVLGLIF